MARFSHLFFYPVACGGNWRALPPFSILIFLISFSFIDNAWAQSLNSKIREGVSHYQQNKFEEAKTSFTETLKEKPADPKLLYNLANSQFKLGNHEEALQTYTQSGTGNSPPGLKQKALYNSGNALFRMGKLEEAEKAYKKVLELNPRDMDAKFNLEFVREKLKKQKQSQQEKDQKQQDSNNEGDGDQDQNSPPSSQDEPEPEANNPENLKDENSSPPETAQNPPPSPSGPGKTEESPQKMEPVQEGNISKNQADHWLSALEEDLKTIRQKQARKEQSGSHNPDKDW